MSKWANKTAGTTDKDGYCYIKIGKKIYSCHRLAFLMMTGKHPINEIDHIDGDKHNNKWSNLREATRTENNRNTKVKSNSRSGIKGVFFNKRCSLYFSSIRVNGKRFHLGYFKTIEECLGARKAAEVKYHGNFARQS